MVLPHGVQLWVLPVPQGQVAAVSMGLEGGHLWG